MSLGIYQFRYICYMYYKEPIKKENLQTFVFQVLLEIICFMHCILCFQIHSGTTSVNKDNFDLK